MTLSTDKPFFVGGDRVRVTDVKPDPFYCFNGFTVTDADGLETGYQVVASLDIPAGAVTVTPVFSEIRITANASPGGTVAVSKDYDTGLATFTATPNEGYTFVNWTNEYGHTVSTDAVYIFHPTYAYYYLTAHFAEAYAVTVNGGTGGGQFACGDSVTVTAGAPPTGKQFKEWTGADGLTFSSGSAASATATFSMPAHAVTLTATYEDPMTWSDVKTAFEAGNNVTLKNDVTRDARESIDITGTVVLDLNGHTLDGGGQLYDTCPLFEVIEGGDLTVTDGSADGNGSICNVWGTASIYVYENDADHVGRCTLSGGTLTDRVYISQYSCFMMTDGLLDGGGVDIDGGAFIMTGGCIKNCATGVNSFSTGSFTMTGGSITGCNTGINIDNNDLVLQNVSISGNTVNICYFGTNYTDTCYGLTVEMEHGSVTLSLETDKPFLAAGDTVIVTDLMPDPFYRFGDTITVTDADGRETSVNIKHSFVISAGAVPFTVQCEEIVVTAVASPAEGGTVAVSKDYDTGCATLTATPNEGYAFVNWTEALYVASTNAVYSIYPDESIRPVAHFAPLPEPLAADNVILSWSSICHNGSVQKPAVAVTNAAGETLAEDTDYTLAWSGDCTAVGSYTVTVSGMGSYTGSVEKSFSIAEHYCTEKPTFTWAKNHSSCAATFICGGCGETVSCPATVTKEWQSGPDEYGRGNYYYVAGVTVNGTSYYDFTHVFEAEGEAPSNLCKWCEKDHSGNFGQKIIGFFHSILYFFAHLFGRK